MLLKDLKKIISNKIHNHLNSKFENLNNKNLFNSYKKILNYSNQNNLKYRSLLIDGHFYNLGYFIDYNY